MEIGKIIEVIAITMRVVCEYTEERRTPSIVPFCSPGCSICPNIHGSYHALSCVSSWHLPQHWFWANFVAPWYFCFQAEFQILLGLFAGCLWSAFGRFLGFQMRTCMLLLQKHIHIW
jgi:hypothetical protein